MAQIMLSPESKCVGVEGEIKSLIKVWLSILASLCYCYFIASNLPKGKLRFLSLTPVLCLFTILPLQLYTVLGTGLTAFFITWLTNFKLLLLAFDLGPLSSNPPKSLPLFISFACFPIKIKQKDTHPSKQNPSKFHLTLLPIKALIFSMLLIALNDHKEKLHPTAVLGLYCCMVYLIVDVIIGLCNVVVSAALGMELELPSNDPYFSTSLQDFWGRRWNLMVTNLLRHTVYIPVRSVFNTILGPKWASVCGVIAAFLVSGLMHELLFYCVTRGPPTWEVTWFFMIHGGCVVLEFLVGKSLSQKWKLHWAVSGPTTVAFVVATAAWLFFPPLLRKGADERTIKEFRNLVDCIFGDV